ncbi:amidohydrolase family protein [Ovoidimarina sediminis]|uniref:amidohydrolase family protein n=1 Tax=Ovoidimarina sediminis TaxID=3079856 RepID=UPI002914487C|nr:amidohydrolase family protein [Rhodophyticola sp. MJ-SS7]MDU8943565.1 amidohydrolase family protein [Rhodophyticola sp. MJ-SS7]
MRVDRIDACLPGVLVPRALLARADDFGGSQAADCLAGDLVIRNGRAVGLAASDAAACRMILPRFTEPHVHLDKCHTVGRMQDVGGDLAAAIAAQKADKINWTADDIRGRAARGMRELEAAGCGIVRTHVDWGDDRDPGAVPPAWEIVGELASESAMTVQLAALTDIRRMADAEYARGCARRLAREQGVLGAFVFDQPERDAGLANMFREADRVGLALDFHVDEGLEQGLDGLERIADAALRVGFEGPVVCGHACSLANLPHADVTRIAEKLAQADIAVVMLPQTNLYLQGRTTGTPDRRGITRLHELRAAGVTVALGADNVRDAFCPIGRHDPLHVLGLSVLAAHLDPPLGDHLPMITTNAVTALGLAPRTVDGAAIGDLLVFDATDSSELLCGARPRRLPDALGAFT